MTLFQACLSPGQTKVHIRQDKQFLTICQTTSSVRDVTGIVPHQTLCRACINAMAAIMKAEMLTGNVIPKCDTPEGLAQAIGIERFV
jgi:bacterioferritin-associated ferredoxin